jgi:hypothetical protein
MRREHANFSHGVYAGSPFPRHDRLFDTLVLRARPQPSHRLLLCSYCVSDYSVWNQHVCLYPTYIRNESYWHVSEWLVQGLAVE